MSTEQNAIYQKHKRVEDELKKVIDDCKILVNKNNAVLKTNPLMIKRISSSINMKDDDLTLEKVVRDMTTVLYDLKNGIKLVKSQPKISSSNIVENANNLEKELENFYQKHEETKKQEEEKKKAAAANANKQEIKKPGNNRQVVKRGSKQNTTQKRASSTDKSTKKTSSTSRPGSATSNKDQSKIIVTTMKFPTENDKVLQNGSSIRTVRPSSNPEQGVKRLPYSAGKRVASIVPPREIYNPLGILKDEVERAIREKKTFTIKGQFFPIRRALLKRGWIEKYHVNYKEKIQDDIRRYQQMTLGELVELLRNKEIAPIVKRFIKSKLLKDHQVDLYWDHTYDAYKECPDKQKLTIINKFRRESVSYTSKQGLCQAARENHWLQIPGVARINHPRCYVLTKGGDTKSFLKDFGLTAATCLLKWVVKTNITGESKVISGSGKISVKVYDFAITECYKFIKRKKHQDIDEEIKDALEKEWNDFLEQFYKIVHIGNHFGLTDKTVSVTQVTKDMVRKANYLLNELREYMTCLNMDGYMNIWILKPTNSSRGEGIHMCRTLQYILDIVRQNPTRRYIIQKYIERPLLIHDTKFDIRQWFLVSSASPLTIWIYKICYLRFSCQTYNLRKLHESIHLTNNSVQAKYMRNVSRDPLLPSYGMWDSMQFKNYLSDIGYPTIFDDVIQPGMKQCITGAMIAHRDKIDKRKNCFEMYGADFMLTEEFEPWLLEINSNPALHSTTPITARLCPQVLEDVIKVVVDYARNKDASTGHFELIYEEKLENQTANTKATLQVTGTPIPENYFCDIPAEAECKTAVLVPTKFETPDPGRFLLQTGETMKQALKNLLEIVKREKMKRFVIKYSGMQKDQFLKEYLKRHNRDMW